jgi:hypothetical protein
MPRKKKRDVVRCSESFKRKIRTREMPKNTKVVDVLNSPAINRPKNPSTIVIIMYRFSGTCAYAGPFIK